MPKQRELIAEFIRERNVFNNEDETRVVIADVRDISCDVGDPLGIEFDHPVTIKGEAAEGQLRPGLVYRFYGHWFTHWKHGEQFVFAAFTVEQPATEDAVVAYLQQCKGIGPGIARRLWDNYGSNAIAALRTNPAKCADEVKGLKADIAAAAAEFLEQFEGVERVKTDLMGLLAGRGFPKKTVDHAIKAWGSDAAAVIRRCPYYLMRFRGCGFLKTDKMYLDLGLPPAKLKRQALCAWHAIARDSEGHTWYPLSVAQGAISRSVSGGQLKAEKATDLAVRAGYLAVKEQDGCMWVAEAAKANQEERCARAIDEAMDEECSWPAIDVLAEQGLSEHQLQELTKALGGVVGILAGAPGTGKTHSAAAVIREIIRSAGDGMVAAAAPTGKAAVRLTELLDANGISLKAITIHRLLQVESSGDGGWGFRYRSGNPLPFRYVLIDESSMIDTGLMASLLEARAPGTHYLFLGDPYQLAPVGHGCPLKDMISAGVPCGELKEIRRNAGRIVRACAAIRDDQRFVPSPAVDLENGENLMHVETSGHAETVDRLRQFVESIKASGKYDPVWDVQILCAVNKKSPLGRRPLNDLLQGILNAGGEQAPPNKFRRGDKVIDLKNGWLQSQDPKHPEANDQGKVFVANGEIGESLIVEPARTICRLQSPDRVVTILHSKAGGKGGGEGEPDEDDKQGPGRKDEESDDDTGTGSTWDLAFAISCHKSQGSEFPVVVILLDEHPSAGRVCTRNWLFTGISRAKKLCVTIGPARVAHAMCQKDGLRRRTFLVERIRELRLPPPPEPVAVSDEVFAGIFEGLALGASA